MSDTYTLRVHNIPPSTPESDIHSTFKVYEKICSIVLPEKYKNVRQDFVLVKFYSKTSACLAQTELNGSKFDSNSSFRPMRIELENSDEIESRKSEHWLFCDFR